MRLETLDLTRYGRFSDKRIDFAPPAADGTDLHILYGPNEAGKSTLFAAWMDLLFGIPARTRYDFLHPGPTMQIGARLSEAGRTLDLRRLKRNGQSLFDIHGAPLPEAALLAMLGGLSREGYAGMFSLDDETLEKGGETILSSKGDLGEMLFSASAGLAELGPRLAEIRAELDGFYNGKRSGRLIDAKKQLTELQARRRDLEVSASAVKALARDVEATEAAWRAARAAEDTVTADLDRLQARAASLPLWQRLAQLKADLAPLDHLPPATEAMRARFEQIEARRLQLADATRARNLRLRALEDRIAALAPDPAVLALAEAIVAAEALRPEHDTALRDLPRREAEAQGARQEQHRLLAELGQTGADVAGLLVAPATLSTLRALLQARSGLLAALAAAETEQQTARDALETETLRNGEPGPEEEDEALAALLTRLKRHDPAELRRLAVIERDGAQARLDQALLSLAPWQGDAAVLAAVVVPSQAQISDWEGRLEEARRAEADAGRDLTATARQLQSLRDKLGAQDLPGLSLSEAAAARARREALWAEHRADLSQQSAALFEQALREDDQITALLAEALAQMRRAAADLQEETRLVTQLATLKAAQTAAAQAHAAVLAEIAAQATGMGLAADSGLAVILAWLTKRDEALERARALDLSQRALFRAEADVARAAAQLCEAMGLTSTSYEVALGRAQTRLEAADWQREARRRLAALRLDLTRREKDFVRAQGQVREWQRNWDKEAAATPLAGRALTGDGAALGGELERLDALGAATRLLAGLEDRMAKMAANRDRFLHERAAILGQLGLGDLSWDDLLQRLRQAETAAQGHQLLSQEAEREQLDARADALAQAACLSETAAFGAEIDWPSDQLPLAEHLGQCLQAAVLRQDIARLQGELRQIGPLAGEAPGFGDPDAGAFADPYPEPEAARLALQAEITALRGDHQLLRASTERCHEAHLRAVQALQAVGGDEALTRIASERAALLEELAEQSRRHLAARLGLLAVETALLRYRDAHRSAMLERASQAFVRLSHGAYSGLAAQPDGTQEVLVALDRSGATKLAQDLSKGTRFQLYLALRISGYHELAQSRPTVPFVADDIMETFDDGRSAAAFGLLSEMSRAGQVIYLTHHRHLCDIAREASPGAKIIDLSLL